MSKFLHHVHTEISYDSNIRIEELLDYLIKNHIEYFSITDHDTFEGCKIAEAQLKKSRYKKLKLIKGEEIKTEYGDIVALFIDKEIKSRKFKEVIREIRDQKGLVIIPHPFSKHTNTNFITKYADGIEIYNCRTSDRRNDKAMNFAEKNPRLLRLAAADSHSVGELANALNSIEIGKEIKVKPLYFKNSGVFCRLVSLKNTIFKKIRKSK